MTAAITDAVLEEQARQAFRESLAAGQPMTGYQLGSQCGRSDRWGRERIAEVAAELQAEFHPTPPDQLPTPPDPPAPQVTMPLNSTTPRQVTTPPANTAAPPGRPTSTSQPNRTTEAPQIGEATQPMEPIRPNRTTRTTQPDGANRPTATIHPNGTTSAAQPDGATQVTGPIHPNSTTSAGPVGETAQANGAMHPNGTSSAAQADGTAQVTGMVQPDGTTDVGQSDGTAQPTRTNGTDAATQGGPGFPPQPTRPNGTDGAAQGGAGFPAGVIRPDGTDGASQPAGTGLPAGVIRPDGTGGVAPGGGVVEETVPQRAGARAVSWVAFVFGVVVSVAANVAHTLYPTDAQLVAWQRLHPGSPWHAEVGSQLAAAFWPVALLLAVEVLSRVRWRAGAWWALARYGGTGTVALVAAFMSYRHMAGLLTVYGEDALSAHVGPLAVDGLMVVAGFALLSMGPRPASRPPSR